MIAVSVRRHDGLVFALGFAVLVAGSWLVGVLLIGIAEVLADNQLNDFELGENLDLLSTIVAVIGAVTVPATTGAWCVIVRARWQTTVVATAVSIAFYTVGTIGIYRLWEWFNQPIVGVG